MTISCMVTTWNRLELTKRCLESLLKNTFENYKLVIVDNCSTDGTRQYIESIANTYSHVETILLNRNMGIAIAKNMALECCYGSDLFVTIDNDIEVLDKNWLSRLIYVIENYDIGFSAYRFCEWHKPNGKYLKMPSGMDAQITDVCGGAMCCMTKKVYDTIGYWNEGYGRYGHEDQDYSWRVSKAGFQLAYLECENYAKHLGYIESVDKNMEENKKKINNARITGDIAYSCYLLLFDEGIIPLKLPRKYLSKKVGSEYKFDLNPEFKPIMKLVQDMSKTVNVNMENNFSCIDLGAWKGLQSKADIKGIK